MLSLGRQQGLGNLPKGKIILTSARQFPSQRRHRLLNMTAIRFQLDSLPQLRHHLPTSEVIFEEAFKAVSSRDSCWLFKRLLGYRTLSIRSSLAYTLGNFRDSRLCIHERFPAPSSV